MSAAPTLAQLPPKAGTYNHRRDHVFALERAKHYVVILVSFVSQFDCMELLVLGYLLSIPKDEHPSERELSENLGIGVDRLKATLKSLQQKGILFRDFVRYGSNEKSIWHVAHPCRWTGSAVPVAPSIDPRMYESRRLAEPRERINEAREYILSQTLTTVRLPNLLFKIDVSWRAKYVYLQLCLLHENQNPTVSQIATILGSGWGTAYEVLAELATAGMISTEEKGPKGFGSKRLIHHLTDVYDWKCRYAKVIYGNAGRSAFWEIDRHARWESQRHLFRVLPNMPSGSSGQVRANGENAPLCSSNQVRTTINEVRTSSAQVRTTSRIPSLHLVQPLSRKGLGACPPSKKTIEESPEEDAHARDGRSVGPVSIGDAAAEHEELTLARIINIANSADHIWTKGKGRKYDPGLWTDIVLEVATLLGEAGARKFVRYASEVFEAVGCQRLRYTSMTVEDLRDGFLGGVPAAELFVNRAAVAANSALECEVLAHYSHSGVTPSMAAADGTLPLFAAESESVEPALVFAATDGEPQSIDLPVATDRDPLADLPADEDRLRWLVAQILPKLGKSQKADLREQWLKRSPHAAIRRFAAQFDQNRILVMDASADLLKTGILKKADVPLLPWENPEPAGVEPETPALEAAPSLESVPPSMTAAGTLDPAPTFATAMSDFRECQERMLAGQKADEDAPLTRARLDNAFAVLARDMKWSIRTRMLMELGQLSDADLWSHLAEKFTESKLREVLRDIP